MRDGAKALSKKIDDGRTSPLSEAPYLTANDEWAIQLTGDVAASISAVASVGAAVSIRADISVDGSSSKPILTQNSSMFQFLKDGVDNTALTASHPQSSTSDPMTFAAIDKTTKKVYFIAVDGRQSWVSLGVTFYEAYRIAKKLGCYNMTRFDGGGSTSMWVYSDGTGALVNKPSDSKGERSCMNYMHIRVKK
jgi:exopolysaccharide biosynthesis protein